MDARADQFAEPAPFHRDLIFATPDPDLAAARELNRQFDQALPRAAQWLLKHQDSRKRAAGLLYYVGASRQIDAQSARVESLAEDERFRDYDSIRQGALDALIRAKARHDDLQKLEPGELLDRFEQAIRTTTDRAALAWLATACATANIEAFCVDAGLDDAVVRHDDANLLSRSTLFPDAEAGRRARLIIDAENTRNYFSQLTAVWFEALDQGPAAAVLTRPYDKFVGAISISMAHGIPAYQPLTRACRAQITPDGKLDRPALDSPTVWFQIRRP